MLLYKKIPLDFRTINANTGEIMEQIFRETKTQIAFHKSTSPDFPAHINDDIELIFTRSGSGTAWCDGKKYALTDNSWFLVFPNQVHRYVDCVPGDYTVLIMKPSDLLRYNQVFLKGVPGSALHCFPSGEDDGVADLLENALREYQRDGYSDIIAAYLTALFGKLLTNFPVEKASFSRDNVLKILQYCTTHCKEDLTVESVAEALSISRSCVSHIFSSRISMPFCDYINSLRLSEATELLKNRDYSITEVSNLSGFPTIRTFNRAFQKRYGMPPTAYRKTQRWPAE